MVRNSPPVTPVGRVGVGLSRKAVLLEQCRRWRTLTRTGYFCLALDMFTIMIGVWAMPYAI